MRRSTPLRVASVAGALAVACGLLGAPAGAQQPATIRFVTFTPPRAVLLAQDLGLLAQQGLALDLGRASDSEVAVQRLLDGDLDVVTVGADNVVNWVEDRGADIFMFMLSQGPVTQQLFVRPEIRAVEDLRGATLAVDSPDAGFATILRRILLRHGLVADRDYRFLQVGSTPLRTAALLDGRAAGAMLGEASPETVAAGIHALAHGADYAPVWSADAYVTTRRWAADQPHLLLGFIRALIAANAWLADPANADAAVASIARTDRVDEARARRLYQEARAGLAEPSVEAQVRVDVVPHILDLRAEVGLLPGPLPPTDRFVNPHWYALALQGVR